jgi:general secretion pathway protein G
MKKSFTIIELIFVLIVLGILAAVALPKFSESLKQAEISKAQSKVTAIRSALQVYKNKHILLGESPYPDSLTQTKLFDVILPPGIDGGEEAGEWKKLQNERYKFHIGNGEYVIFKYDKTKGSFECESSNPQEVCSSF